MNGVTYDAGALIAAERDSESLWMLHRELLARDERPTLTTAVLGQVWRGGPQARLSRLLRGCRIEPLTESQARSAGAALAASDSSDLLDAAVVVTALVRDDLIVTSDPDDLRRIAAAIGRDLAVHVV
ncbi:MAG TPA: PIN domain-containing protein [Solirubrobacteraceae bacterium]